jgi:hypothetical protein
MKTKMNLIGINVLLICVLTLLFAACSEKVVFLNSAVVPAAEGSVSIKKGNNDNYNIDLYVKNLADPSRLTPPRAVYVVWMETAQSGVQNIGQLKTGTHGLSQMMSSSLETVSPHQPTGFIITAEDDAIGSYPGITVVLKTATIVLK